jgi:4-diphosphocytidyl-2-C-methyl-D-erythritol kinase
MLSAPADVLVVGPAAAGVVRCTVHGGDAVPAGEDNLVVRAARGALPADAGLAVDLTKVTPVGAGLGGGSADAAAVLRVVRDRYGVDPARILDVAASIGSDVPVCVDGRPVMMRGRGEILDPVVIRGRVPVVVATPPVALSTPAVYRAWDELGGPRGERTVDPPAPVAHLVDALVNDLEPAALRVAPVLEGFRDDLGRVAGGVPLLAGSGSSYWMPLDDPDRATAVAARVRAELGVTAFGGWVLDRGIEVEERKV